MTDTSETDETKDWNTRIIEEFRANDGKVGGPFEGASLLLLTTAGARSGKPRISPLMYLADGDRVLVFGSYAGGPRHPAWYHNLRANPRATVEIGTRSYEVTADEVSGAERDELYARQVAVAPGFGEYQAKTDRIIPVVALRPVGGASFDLG
ncbi:nitroreductase family deazaflavin-dependent oxidoreductase [Actinopolymorpha singaporensis]|uniref:Deazaflavin-dependent oxidoreductase, nitroreductase family n=1 Tax=Actinopolymorpha singaporensis TaxID=117157 RepID=A0A1H1QFV2_9ACTN|nr:nitroreductase family deazaflavin-dependent oxidoreductase [Actinopolymorpha singaporensis]SDS22296.1 deazaflavin-dependent oxidoreductase, nitroreductase family [Actinopolymorpha singaporensis]